MSQLDLFSLEPGAPPQQVLPEGFEYQPEFLSVEEERDLVAHLAGVGYADIRMHGVVAKRRAAHFGLDYEYQTAAVAPGVPIPAFLLPLRERAGSFTGRRPEEFAELLVTEYPAGAGIGWHRDAPAFEIVVGISLLAACTMQFRPWPVARPPPGSARASREKPLSLVLEPRSAYIIRGPSRSAWQHHIPTTPARRISLTFRTLRGAPRP